MTQHIATLARVPAFLRFSHKSSSMNRSPSNLFGLSPPYRRMRWSETPERLTSDGVDHRFPSLEGLHLQDTFCRPPPLAQPDKEIPANGYVSYMGGHLDFQATADHKVQQRRGSHSGGPRLCRRGSMASPNRVQIVLRKSLLAPIQCAVAN